VDIGFKAANIYQGAGSCALDCATCQRLEEVVDKTSRDWAFAEQLAELSGRVPESAEPARRNAEATRKQYESAAAALAEHRRQCKVFQCRAADRAGGVS
jgi:hypothetical protein